MRITRKGQVTIPLEIRRRAGFLPGTEVAVVMDGDVVRIVRKQPDDKSTDQRMAEFQEWLSKVRGTATAGLTSDEILSETRGYGDDGDPGRL
jgi:AbrB family looped-hinge helix DNA binding protein